MLTKKTKTAIKCTIIIIGVIVLPVVYSFFYLDAFWDPYNTLSTLPVAVVNSDVGAVINGKQRNLGSEMEDKLRKNSDIKWISTDADTAQKGLDGKSYYAVLSIPSNFSANVATAQDLTKVPAKITYVANEKRNFIASQILTRVFVELEEQTRGEIDKDITSNLVDKLNEVPGDLNKLNDGLSQLKDGSSQLQTGAGSLLDGQNTLGSGIASLNSGLARLLSGTGTLKTGAFTLDNGLGSTLSGAKQLQSGVSNVPALINGISTLNGGASKLSSGISQTLSGAKQLESGTAGLGQLTGGISTLDTGASTLAAGLSQASSGASALNSGAASITALNSGISNLDTGASQLSAGVNTYFGTMDSILSAAAKNQQLMGGVSQIYAATTDPAQKQSLAAMLALMGADAGSDPYISAAKQQLEASRTGLVNGASAVASGADQLKASEASLTALQQGIASLNTALGQLSTGAASLTAGADQLKAGSQSLSQLSSGINQLETALDQLNSGAAALSSGTQSLAANKAKLTQLQQGVGQLEAAVQKLKDGSAQISSGATQLNSGAAAAVSGGGALADGSQKLANGASQLSDGASQISSGISEAQNKVSSAVSQANSELGKTKGLDSYTASPVSIKDATKNVVPNYGTGFAPYFMSLSLWVGAILIFFGIYLDPDNRLRRLSRFSENKIFRVVGFVLIGFAQAIVLAVAVRYGLNLKVADMPAYFLSCVLVSIVFISIVEFLIIQLKDLGKFLSLVLLILQLTSCGGTFPMETVPKLFNVLYPFMPMTYSVGLFKDTISGMSGAVYFNVSVLVGMFVVFTALTLIFSVTKRKAKQIIDNKNAA